MSEHPFLPPLGATIQSGGVAYRVWAPAVSFVQVDIRISEGGMRNLPLQREDEGYHMGWDVEGRAGDAYFYDLEGYGNLPDPVSRGQQTDVHGRSLVIDARNYSWRDVHWQRPCFRDLIIYELHIGAFTSEGTFRSAVAHLKELRELGITAIEILPIADFPGERNWGYDGVLPYAPARCYGSPDDLRALVDAAHSHGLAVILDVVYNHFGPRGNYLACFSPHYFKKDHPTPWGDSFNFDSEMCGPVREFFVQNPIYWMEEFHIDGFRLDATHEIHDNSHPHLLAEMSVAIHKRGGYAIAEDERNCDDMVQPVEEGGMGFDGVWADDFHHILRVGQTKEKVGYFRDYKGSLAEVISTLECGWLYQGQISPRIQSPRGRPCRHLPTERFIHCISNHDQTGNHAFGKRLAELISPVAYRTLSALLCLSPYTPLIFMGQEWAASTPFLYFTDHEPELGSQITEGRRREFSEFSEFRDPEARKRIPDPQSEPSFLNSKLRWQESKTDHHAEIRALYLECLSFRRMHLRSTNRKDWCVTKLLGGVVKIHYKFQEAEYLVIFDLLGGHSGTLDLEGNWALVLSTEGKRFGGEEGITFDSASQAFHFAEKGLILLAWTPNGFFSVENCKRKTSQNF